MKQILKLNTQKTYKLLGRPVEGFFELLSWITHQESTTIPHNLLSPRTLLSILSKTAILESYLPMSALKQQQEVSCSTQIGICIWD